MLRRLKWKKGIAALPTILLISAIITEISLAAVFVVYFLNQSSFGLRDSGEAMAAAQSGIQDALLKIIRNKDLGDVSYPLTITENRSSADVAITKDILSGEYTVSSVGKVLNKRRKLEGIVIVNSITGEAIIESLKETAL